jgi:hypothetical protein
MTEKPANAPKPDVAPAPDTPGGADSVAQNKEQIDVLTLENQKLKDQLKEIQNQKDNELWTDLKNNHITPGEIDLKGEDALRKEFDDDRVGFMHRILKKPAVSLPNQVDGQEHTGSSGTPKDPGTVMTVGCYNAKKQEYEA